MDEKDVEEIKEPFVLLEIFFLHNYIIFKFYWLIPPRQLSSDEFLDASMRKNHFITYLTLLSNT